MDNEDWESIIFAAAVAFLLGMAITLIIYSSMERNYIKISQETADDICYQLTGNESVVAKDYWDFSNDGIEGHPIEKGKLVCELPSYDSTQNIVVMSNSQ